MATLQIGNRLLSGHFSIVLVTQLQHWASGLRFAPDASFYAPEFQVVTVRRTGLLKLIRIILAAKTGQHLKFREVEVSQAREVHLHFAKAAAVQIDGDILRFSGREVTGHNFRLSKLRTQIKLSAYH
jgi:diacylglycerol kinase family enzyme